MFTPAGRSTLPQRPPPFRITALSEKSYGVLYGILAAADALELEYLSQTISEDEFNALFVELQTALNRTMAALSISESIVDKFCEAVGASKDIFNSLRRPPSTGPMARLPAEKRNRDAVMLDLGRNFTTLDDFCCANYGSTPVKYFADNIEIIRELLVQIGATRVREKTDRWIAQFGRMDDGAAVPVAMSAALRQEAEGWNADVERLCDKGQ
jgi:hypothetical protein